MGLKKLMQEDSMALTITLYVLIGINLGWIALGWENQYGVSNLTKLQDSWSLFKNREHFGAQDYR